MVNSIVKKNIPKGWQITTIESICENLDNLRKPVTRSNREAGDVAYYGATGIVDYVKNYIFDEPLLLIGEDGADWSKFANTAYEVDGKSWVNNHAHVLRCIKVDRTFLKEYLNHEDLNSFITGGTRGKLTKGVLSKIPILLPSLIEQKNIAEILSTVDDEIQKTDEIISATKKLKRGLMQKLLFQGGGESTTLENIGDFKRGPFGGALKKEIFVENGYKVYEQKNAIYNDFSLGSYFIDGEKFREMRGFALRSGDIIISCSGTLGKVAVVPMSFNEGIINQALLKITPSKDWDVLYIKYLLESEYIQNRFVKVAPGSAMKNMASMQTIKSTKITKPTLKEQQKIADILSLVDSKISVNKKLKEKLTELKKGLMQDLLSGRIRVK